LYPNLGSYGDVGEQAHVDRTMAVRHDFLPLDLDELERKVFGDVVVVLEKEGQLAWLTFARKRYLNAMNNACTVQLLKITHALERDQ